MSLGFKIIYHQLSHTMHMIERNYTVCLSVNPEKVAVKPKKVRAMLEEAESALDRIQ